MATFSGSFSTERTSYPGQIYPYLVTSINSLQTTRLNGVTPPLTALSQSLNVTCNELSITIAAINHTTVRVTYSQPVGNNRALRDPLNYVFTPSMVVCSVTPNDPNVVSYVDLEVVGMTNQSYSLTIQQTADEV